MSWLLWALILAAGVVILFFRQRKEQTSSALECGSKHMPSDDAIEVADEAELLAVIMAAVTELECSSEFQILSIKPSSSNWRLTGQQDLMGSRL